MRLVMGRLLSVFFVLLCIFSCRFSESISSDGGSSSETDNVIKVSVINPDSTSSKHANVFLFTSVLDQKNVVFQRETDEDGFIELPEFNVDKFNVMIENDVDGQTVVKWQKSVSRTYWGNIGSLRLEESRSYTVQIDSIDPGKNFQLGAMLFKSIPVDSAGEYVLSDVPASYNKIELFQIEEGELKEHLEITGVAKLSKPEVRLNVKAMLAVENRESCLFVYNDDGLIQGEEGGPLCTLDKDLIGDDSTGSQIDPEDPDNDVSGGDTTVVEPGESSSSEDGPGGQDTTVVGSGESSSSEVDPIDNQDTTGVDGPGGDNQDTTVVDPDDSSSSEEGPGDGQDTTGIDPGGSSSSSKDTTSGNPADTLNQASALYWLNIPIDSLTDSLAQTTVEERNEAFHSGSDDAKVFYNDTTRMNKIVEALEYAGEFFNQAADHSYPIFVDMVRGAIVVQNDASGSEKAQYYSSQAFQNRIKSVASITISNIAFDMGNEMQYKVVQAWNILIRLPVETDYSYFENLLTFLRGFKENVADDQRTYYKLAAIHEVLNSVNEFSVGVNSDSLLMNQFSGQINAAHSELMEIVREENIMEEFNWFYESLLNSYVLLSEMRDDSTLASTLQDELYQHRGNADRVTFLEGLQQ